MFELIPFERHARNVAAFDPFRELDELERSFFGNGRSVSSFRTDVTDTGDAYKLEAELPGFKKEDVNASLKDGVLTVTAETKSETDDTDKKGTFVRKERFSGKCTRSYYVGDEIEEADVKARFENGTLKIDVPKKQPKPQLETTTNISID